MADPMTNPGSQQPNGTAPIQQAGPPSGQSSSVEKAVAYSREELLEQAAQQPDTTFVLPKVVMPAVITEMKIVETISKPEKPLPKRKPPIDFHKDNRQEEEEPRFEIRIDPKANKKKHSLFSLKPVVSLPGIPSMPPLPVPPPPKTEPEKPNPVLPPPPKYVPEAKKDELKKGEVPAPPSPALPVPQPPATAPATEAEKPPLPSPHKRNWVPLTTVLGCIVGAGLLGAVAYALSLNGVRIPFFYPYVSGLPTGGKEVALQAAAAVRGAGSYSYQWEATVQAEGKQAEPDVQAYKESKDPVRSLKSTATSGVNIAKEFAATDIILTADNLPSARTSLKQPLSWDGAKTPASVADVATLDDKGNPTMTLIKMKDSDLREWLPTTVLIQPNLADILGGMGKEKQYAKSLNEKPGARYGYTLASGFLNRWLPSGAAWENGILEMDVPWKSGVQPAWVQVSGTFRYGDVSYILKWQWQYLQFLNIRYPASLDTTEDAAGAAKDSTAENFWVLMGLTPARLPHALQAAQPAPTPTPSASPSPTATPWQAIVPTGDVISAVTARLPENPVVPSVTTAGRQRDVQRKKDLADLAAAFRQYKAESGKYPAVSQATQLQYDPALFKLMVPKYLVKMPIDPLRQTFWYEYRSDGATFSVRSVVEDPADPAGKEGTVYRYLEVSGN